MRHTSRDSLKKDENGKNNSTIEGTLKKLFGFKPVEDFEGKKQLSCIIKCIDFKVEIDVTNMEKMDISVVSKHDADYRFCFYSGRYNFNLLKKFYNRYTSLK